MFLTKVIFIFSLSLFSLPVFAKKNAENSFSLGLSAAKTGEFKVAIEHFRQARRLGKRSDALFYNLGVCFYKINDYEAAISWFELLLRSEKNRGLALYNLGLAHAKLGRDVKALRWFKRVLKSDADRKLKILAAKQIKKLYAVKKTAVIQRREQKKSASSKRFLSGASLDLGWDDNIIYPSSATSTDEGDAYSKYLAWTKVRVLGDTALGLHLKALGYGTQYQNASDYDRQLLQVAITPYWRWNKWTYEFALSQEFSYLGSESYLSASKYTLSARNYIQPGTSASLKYGFEDFKDASSGSYPYLQGKRQYLSFKFYETNGVFRYTLQYEVEKNDRRDLATNQYFFSYSPFRQTLSVLWQQTWDSRIITHQGISYRYSQYQDDNVFSENGEETIRQRHDDHLSFQLGLELRLNQHLSLELNYMANKNDSNVMFYEYQQNLLSAGLRLKM